MSAAEYFTPTEVAARWRMSSPQSLANMRCRGKGPDYVNLGSRVLYPVKAVQDYEEAHLVTVKRPANDNKEG